MHGKAKCTEYSYGQLNCIACSKQIIMALWGEQKKILKNNFSYAVVGSLQLMNVTAALDMCSINRKNKIEEVRLGLKYEKIDLLIIRGDILLKNMWLYFWL